MVYPSLPNYNYFNYYDYIILVCQLTKLLQKLKKKRNFTSVISLNFLVYNPGPCAVNFKRGRKMLLVNFEEL